MLNQSFDDQYIKIGKHSRANSSKRNSNMNISQ